MVCSSRISGFVPRCTRLPPRQTRIRPSSHSCTHSTSSIESFIDSFLFPPQDDRSYRRSVRDELREQKIRKRPGRSYPRAVKRKMSGFPVTTTALRHAAYKVRSSEVEIA